MPGTGSFWCKKCLGQADISRGAGRAKRALLARFAGERSEPCHGVRVRCASARRSSYGMGPGAEPPENFWEIILSRVHFYNRVQFFTPVFKMLKVETPEIFLKSWSV